MPIKQPLSATIYQNNILAALANTGIKQLAPGGKARAFADIVGDMLANVEANAYLNISNSLLPFATGSALDLIGDIYGVSRIGEQTATVISDDLNLQFYVRSGTFGDINGGQDINIPSGVIITSAANSGPTFSVVSNVTLPAAASSVPFNAISKFIGAAGNIPASVLSKHNFTNYKDSRFGSLLVSNDFGIIGGRDTETDDSFRFRINLKIQSRAGANEAALRFAILQIPGIQDIIFKAQSGTFTCYVYGISPQVPTSLLQLVQDQINKTAAFPLVGLAVTPNLIGISLTTDVQFVNGVSSEDKTSIIQTAVAAAETYINNIAIGSPLIINELASIILNSDKRILDIGEPNNEIPDIFIWRSRADDTRYSRFLVANYTPSIGERIVVESSIATPITLVAK